MIDVTNHNDGDGVGGGGDGDDVDDVVTQLRSTRAFVRPALVQACV